MEALKSIGIEIGSVEFDEKYAYTGELGAIYTKESTTLRVWSPLAKTVEVILYASDYGDEVERLPLTKVTSQGSVWEVKLTGDHAGIAYKYGIEYDTNVTSWKGRPQVESVDPYSRSVTVNGNRTVIVDLATTNPKEFKRLPAFTNDTDAVIYELNVRDFTVANSSVKNKGKYLGVIEKEPLTYLKELGVTHVQLMPIFDFATVDEGNPEDYNWGYDPLNYNVPEGSYASNPYKPLTRIKELKEMIKGLHDAGIRVIMDVVYNHVYNHHHSLAKTCPGYYFREVWSFNGNERMLSNGTGCGNDTASERVMMRKYILDSIKYWLTEYKIDGFRFDLMGIHDVDTMLEVRKVVNEIDESILIYGEGWDLNTPLTPHQKATKLNAYRLDGVGFFNDELRVAIKGSDFGSGYDKGFVNGKPFIESWLATNMLGGVFYPTNKGTYLNPAQMINYVEAHDNLTVYDKLGKSSGNAEDLERECKLALTLVLLSQGVPFIHAGQEFMRTKLGNENSYNATDEINHFDWKRVKEQEDFLAYTKGLINLRKSEEVLRLTSKKEILESVNIIKADNGVIILQLEHASSLYYVIVNSNPYGLRFEIELGDYEVLVHEGKVLKDQTKWNFISNVYVPHISATVIKKKKV